MVPFGIAVAFYVALGLALSGYWGLLLALLVIAGLWGGMYKGLTLMGA